MIARAQPTDIGASDAKEHELEGSRRRYQECKSRHGGFVIAVARELMKTDCWQATRTRGKGNHKGQCKGTKDGKTHAKPQSNQNTLNFGESAERIKCGGIGHVGTQCYS